MEAVNINPPRFSASCAITTRTRITDLALEKCERRRTRLPRRRRTYYVRNRCAHIPGIFSSLSRSAASPRRRRELHRPVRVPMREARDAAETGKVRKETERSRPSRVGVGESESTGMRAGACARRAKNVVFSSRLTSLPTAPSRLAPRPAPCRAGRRRDRSTTMADAFRPIRRNAPSTHLGEKSAGHAAATFTRGFLDACRVRRSASHDDPRGPYPVCPAERAHKGGIGRHVRFSRRSHFKGPSGVVVAAAAADRLRVTWLRLLTITPSYYRPQPRDRQVYDPRNY